MKRVLAAVLLTTFIFSGCDKDKRTSSRIDGKRWKTSSVTIDGTPSNEAFEIRFTDCDIYKESCKGAWHRVGGGHSHIGWQVRDKGKTIEIINTSDHAHDLNDKLAVFQSIGFTGVYEIRTSTKTRLVISSAGTYSYSGKQVEIELKN